MRKASKLNPKCPLCGSNDTISDGFRKNKQRILKRYQCKLCKRYFTNQHLKQQSKTYNLITILNTISNYNLGTPLRKQPIPKSTIHDWIKNINLPMNRLRNQLKTKPKHKIIKKQQFIHHQQPFLYQYHSLKLEFARKFPDLISYIKNVHKIPKHIFESSKRISEKSKETSTWRGEAGVAPVGVPSRFAKQTVEANVVEVSKQNYAVELAKLATAITKDNKKRHEIIENFMLINDTATIATEIPIYLKAKETKLNQNLTGHIDILQIRYHKIYILDYKPEPINKQQTINQLKLYQKALSKRTSIPKYKFKLAFFNDKGYYELS